MQLVKNLVVKECLRRGRVSSIGALRLGFWTHVYSIIYKSLNASICSASFPDSFVTNIPCLPMTG